MVRQKFIASDSIVECEIEEGRALLDLNSSKYFSLNETGSLVWDLLNKEPQGIDQIVSRIVAIYDVDYEICKSDVAKIIEELLAAKVVSKE